MFVACFNYSASLYSSGDKRNYSRRSRVLRQVFFLLSMLTKCPNLLGTAENITLKQKQGLFLCPRNIICHVYTQNLHVLYKLCDCFKSGHLFHYFSRFVLFTNDQMVFLNFIFLITLLTYKFRKGLTDFQSAFSKFKRPSSL